MISSKKYQFFKGGVIILKKESVSSAADSMFSHKERITDNRSMSAAHFHSTFEIYYLQKAKATVTYLIDRKIYTVSEGDVILIPPQTLHRVKYSGFDDTVTFSRYLLSFKEAYIYDDMKELFANHQYHLKPADIAEVDYLFKKMDEEFKTFDKYFSRNYKGYLSSLLTLLARKYSTANDANEEKENDTKIDRVISEVIDYIHSNISRDISLTDLSEKFGYSKEYISSRFKSATGCGYNEFLNKTRIAYAVKMLISTSFPIKRIAARCGFKDSNYFAAVFKSYMNISPSQYRKQHNSLAKD